MSLVRAGGRPQKLLVHLQFQRFFSAAPFSALNRWPYIELEAPRVLLKKNIQFNFDFFYRTAV